MTTTGSNDARLVQYWIVRILGEMLAASMPCCCRLGLVHLTVSSAPLAGAVCAWTVRIMDEQ